MAELIEEIIKGRDEAWHDLVALKNAYMHLLQGKEPTKEHSDLIGKIAGTEFRVKFPDLKVTVDD